MAGGPRRTEPPAHASARSGQRGPGRRRPRPRAHVPPDVCAARPLLILTGRSTGVFSSSYPTRCVGPSVWCVRAPSALPLRFAITMAATSLLHRPAVRASAAAAVVVLVLVAALALLDPSGGLLAPVGGHGLPLVGTGGVYRWAPLVVGLPVLLVATAAPGLRARSAAAGPSWSPGPRPSAPFALAAAATGFVAALPAGRSAPLVLVGAAVRRHHQRLGRRQGPRRRSAGRGGGGARPPVRAAGPSAAAGPGRRPVSSSRSCSSSPCSPRRGSRRPCGAAGPSATRSPARWSRRRPPRACWARWPGSRCSSAPSRSSVRWLTGQRGRRGLGGRGRRGSGPRGRRRRRRGGHVGPRRRRTGQLVDRHHPDQPDHGHRLRRRGRTRRDGGHRARVALARPPAQRAAPAVPARGGRRGRRAPARGPRPGRGAGRGRAAGDRAGRAHRRHGAPDGPARAGARRAADHRRRDRPAGHPARRQRQPADRLPPARPRGPGDAAADRRRLRRHRRDGLQRRPPRHVLVPAGAHPRRARRGLPRRRSARRWRPPKEHGLYTVLDLHQDAWGNALARPEQQCGGGTSATTGWDGAPAWATITDGTLHCQFLARDLAPAVATAFGNFYTDRDGIQSALVRDVGEGRAARSRTSRPSPGTTCSTSPASARARRPPPACCSGATTTRRSRRSATPRREPTASTTWRSSSRASCGRGWRST